MSTGSWEDSSKVENEKDEQEPVKKRPPPRPAGPPPRPSGPPPRPAPINLKPSSRSTSPTPQPPPPVALASAAVVGHTLVSANKKAHKIFSSLKTKAGLKSPKHFIKEKKNKSPLPSPSKEKFDIVVPEEKANKSEEWFAFQQLLERTKETVVKTKENLSRLTSRDEPDYSPESESENKAPSLKRKDALDSLDEEIERKDIPQVTVTPVPSPKPPSKRFDPSAKDQFSEQDTDSSLANGIDKASSGAHGGSTQDLLGLGLDDFASPPEPESDDWLSSHKSQFEKDFLLAEEEKLSQSTKSVTDELIDSFLGLEATSHRSPLVSPTVLSPVISISASQVESDPFVLPKIPDPVDLSTIRKGIASGGKTEPELDPFFVKSTKSTPQDPFLATKSSDPFVVTPVEPSTDPFAVSSSDPFAFKSTPTTESSSFTLTADSSSDPFVVTPTKPDKTSLPFLTSDLSSGTSDPFATSATDPFTPVKSGLTTPTTDPFTLTSSGFASPTGDLFAPSPGIPRTSADLFGPANASTPSSIDPFSSTPGHATGTSSPFESVISTSTVDPFGISSGSATPGAELFASAISDPFDSGSGFATPATDFFASSPATEFPTFPAAETSTSDQFTFAAASDHTTKSFPTSITTDPTTSDPFAFAAPVAIPVATPEPYSTVSDPLDFASAFSAGNPFLSAALSVEQDEDEAVTFGFEYFATISEPLETSSVFDFETPAAEPLVLDKDPFSTTSEPIDIASDNFKKTEDLPVVSETRSIIVPRVCITNSFETVSEPVDSNVDISDTVLTPSSPVEPISSTAVQKSEPVVLDSTSDPFRSQSPFGFSSSGSFPPPPPPTDFTDSAFDAAWSTLTPTDISTLPPAVDSSATDSTFSLTNTAFTESANIFTSANMSEPAQEPLFPQAPEAASVTDINAVTETSGVKETQPAALSDPSSATGTPPAVEATPVLEPASAAQPTPELTDTAPQLDAMPPADAPASDTTNIFGMANPMVPMAPLAPMVPLAPTPVPISNTVTTTGESTTTTDSTNVVADFSTLDSAFSAQDDFFSGTSTPAPKGNDFFSSETVPATSNVGGDMFSLLDDSFPAAPTTAPATADGGLQDTADFFGTSDSAPKTDSTLTGFDNSGFSMSNSAFPTLEPSVTPAPAIFTEPAFPAMDPTPATDPTDSIPAMEMSQNNPFEGMESDDVPVPISGNNPFSMFETIEDDTAKEIHDGQPPQTVPSIATEGITTSLDAFLQPSIVPQPVTTADSVVTTEDTTTITTTTTAAPESVSFTDSGANPFMDQTEDPAALAPASATEASDDFFDEDFFNTKTAEKKARDVKTVPKSAWGMMESVDKDSSFNPFQDDNFDAKNIPQTVLDDADTQNQEVPGEPKNPFLSSDFGAASSAPTIESKVNPFLSQVDELEKVQGTLSDNLDLFLSKGQELDPSELPLDVFDPFKTIEPDDIPEPTVTAPPVDSSDDEKDSPDNDDNKDAFKLTIRMRDPVESGPSVALPPPPKVPKSPQMAPRINPFDKESPPEENFAKFEVMETETEKPKAERTETQMSVSTEGSGTPDDEEEQLEPLESFLPQFEGEGWSLMLRQPTKKKLTGNRYWKTIFVRLVQQNDGPVLKLYHSKEDKDTFQELPLQPCYSMSDIALQHYDQYGKIHTLKIQYVFYRERVGIRTEKITPTFVKNMKPKANMILDHSPQISELLKFGSLDEEVVLSFVQEVEDALLRIVAHREKTLSYQKDEVIVDVIDEYKASIDTAGHIISQKARVRIFCLSFVTGMPFVELGVNDRRRKGREVVGRHDIIPIKTEEWIKPENIEFHCSAKPEEYEKDGTIKFHPLDACHFELMRFRVRLRDNKELPLQVRVFRDIKERHVEYRCDVVCTGYHAYSKKHGQFPCEDIEIRFPIPDCWIYLFRYERRFGYGSFKSATRKPGKIKGLERLTMMTQSGTSPALLEASVGTAKYENVHHAIVWRISRLPERNQGAYKTHLFTLRLDLGLHDEIPESYEMFSDVKFTMPASTISKCQIRSISCGNPTPPEKWVRYIAHYEYKVAIDHKFESTQIKKVAEIDKMVEAQADTPAPEEEASSPGTSPES